jgi:hypothetical protein
MMGIKLDFNGAYHPQTGSQTVVLNQSLGNLLRSLAENKPKQWDLALSHAKLQPVQE